MRQIRTDDVEVKNGVIPANVRFPSEECRLAAQKSQPTHHCQPPRTLPPIHEMTQHPLATQQTLPDKASVFHLTSSSATSSHPPQRPKPHIHPLFPTHHQPGALDPFSQAQVRRLVNVPHRSPPLSPRDEQSSLARSRHCLSRRQRLVYNQSFAG